jgi:hypothetical protein
MTTCIGYVSFSTTPLDLYSIRPIESSLELATDRHNFD